MVKNKNFIWVGLALVALIIFMNPQVGKQAAADVSNARVVRSIPTNTVKTGSAFTLTYTAQQVGVGSWGVLIEDDISGGCSPTDIDSGWLSPATTQTFTINTPSSAGACTFSGLYTFADSTAKSLLGASTINICEDQCLAGQTGCDTNTQSWACDTSGVCGIKQTAICGLGQTCSNGLCGADCQTLRLDALQAITGWSTSPTSPNKLDALTKISLWAAGC